jgi:hypothetical protein
MNLTNEQSENIQQYLDDTMTPEEETNFMQEVENNTVLQEAIQFELGLRHNLQKISDDKRQPGQHILQPTQFKNAKHILSIIQNAGNEWHEENKKKLASTKPVAKIISFPFSLSACLLMFVTITVKYMSDTGSTQSTISKNNNADSLETRHHSKIEILVVKPHDSLNNSPSPQTTVNVAGLYKQFYKKDNVPKESKTPELLAEALNNYENDDYKTLQNFDLKELGIRGDEEKGKNSEQNVKETGYYYKGLAFMQSNNVKQAYGNLQWVINNAKNKQLVAKAEWYQALCYLQQGNINNAIDLLTLVSNKKLTPYNKQAAELLQLLK